MTKYSIKDRIMDELSDHIDCSGDDLSDIADDILIGIERWLAENKPETLAKEIKCDLCRLHYDCSVAYDPTECAVEVLTSEAKQVTEK